MKFIILAGGSGKRLWPLSTEERPKQFHSFCSDRTLLQEAFDRLDFAKPEDIFVATNEKYVDLVKEQLPEIPDSNIIAEPALRDTAPCMSFATKYLESLFGDEETISIIYADHLIKNKQNFQSAIKKGHEIALQKDKIVIVEVTATDPNPNLGYVKIGNQLSDDLYELEGFTEKPDLKTAKEYVASKNYLYNTGLYIWKIKTLLNHLKIHSPEISNLLDQVTDFKNSKEIYEKFPKISLDYALMEKIDPKEVQIIKADLGWSDIGTWETLFKELVKTKHDNLQEGKTYTLDTKGSVVINRHPDKKLAVIGETDKVVVVTESAILICPISENQKIKDILEEMNKKK